MKIATAPGWVDFKNYLKHKRKEMSVEYLIVRLIIEEDNKMVEKKGYHLGVAKANVVEHGQPSKTNKSKPFNNIGKFKMGPRGGIIKKKFQ